MNWRFFSLTCLTLVSTVLFGATDQTITFNALPSKVFGDPAITLVASATSNLTVTFSLVNSPTGSLNGNMLSLNGAGLITVRASQAGDATFNPAPVVDQSFVVAKADQFLTFTSVPNKTLGDPPFAAGIASSSGLIPEFEVTGPATLSNGLIFLTGAGEVTLHGSEDGNDNFTPVHDHKSFTVAKGSQTVTLNPINNKTQGDVPFSVGGSSTAGLPLTFSIASGPATVVGNIVTITGAGSVTVRAGQTGNVDYNPARDVESTFTVSQGNQSITFIPFGSKTFGDAPFAVGALATSGLPVTLSVLSGPATVSGSIVTLTGAGSVTLHASQLGNSNYNPALPVELTFAVAKASPAILWNFPDNITAGTPLSSAQLNASTTVAGEFNYIPQAGTLLATGNNQTLVVQFTPQDGSRYNSMMSTVKINVGNLAPHVASLSAAPVSPTVNQSVVFSAAGSDTEAITYAWSFSDGGTGTGASTTRVFTTPGTFQATVVVSDTFGGATLASMTLIVKALSPVVADGGDADGDGFPDAIETAAGTSPHDAAETPAKNAHAGEALTLPDAKLQIKLNFAKPGKDSIALQGSLLIPDGLEIGGATVVVDVAGAATQFELNSKGQFKSTTDLFKLSIKGSGSRTGRFTMTRKKGHFATALSSAGLENIDLKRNLLVSVTILFQEQLYYTRVKQAYKAKKQKTGQTRD